MMYNWQWRQRRACNLQILNGAGAPESHHHRQIIDIQVLIIWLRHARSFISLKNKAVGNAIAAGVLTAVNLL